MNFLFPLAFIGLISIPVVIFIYFFHKRFKPKIVSAIFLWPKQNVVSGSGIKLSNLIKNILLLLEIIMFTILVLAAAGPYCSNKNTVHNVTFILDTSASIGSMDSNGETPKQRAIQQIAEYLKGYEPYNVKLILSGFIPRPVSADIRNGTELKNALENWDTDNIYHSLIPAIQTAEQVTPENGSIIVITDSEPADYVQNEVTDDIQFRFFGKELDNIGITQAVRKQGYSGIDETVFAIIKNFSKLNKTVNIKLLDGETILIDTSIELKSDGMETPVLFEIEQTDSTLRLLIDSVDPMMIDNSVYLVPEENIRIPVKILIQDDELELSIRNILDVFKNRINISEENPALIITDMEIGVVIPNTEESFSENRKESLWVLEFKNAGEKNYYGPFIIDKSHPFTRELMLEGVRWPASVNIEEGYPVISVGNIPLLIEKNLGEKNLGEKYFGDNIKHYIMNINLQSSNIEETLNWPIFFSNLIKNRIDNLSGIKNRNNILGETILARYNNIKSLKIESEDNTVTEISREGNVYPISSEEQGIYKVFINEEEECQVSFLFLSDEESDLRTLSTGVWGEEPEDNLAEYVQIDQIGWLLIIFVMLIFILHLYIQKRYL